MLLKQGNIFLDDSVLDYICITTNSVLNTKGELVMGKGIALAAKKAVPSLPRLFADSIKLKNKSKSDHIQKDYYLVNVGKYIAFQTKRHWREPSPIELVVGSIQRLERLALKYPNFTFGLPFPGVHNGGLTKEQVLPYLHHLPNNVTVYYL